MPRRGRIGQHDRKPRDHIELGSQVKEPGWVEAEPQLLLLPDPVRQAVVDWAMRPRD
jgi:hypothetical protein